MVIPTQRSGADEVAQNYFINVNPCKNVAMHRLDCIVSLFNNATAIILVFFIWYQTFKWDWSYV